MKQSAVAAAICCLLLSMPLCGHASGRVDVHDVDFMRCVDGLMGSITVNRGSMPEARPAFSRPEERTGAMASFGGLFAGKDMLRDANAREMVYGGGNAAFDKDVRREVMRLLAARSNRSKPAYAVQPLWHMRTGGKADVQGVANADIVAAMIRIEKIGKSRDSFIGDVAAAVERMKERDNRRKIGESFAGYPEYGNVHEAGIGHTGSHDRAIAVAGDIQTQCMRKRLTIDDDLYDLRCGIEQYAKSIYR